MMSNSMSTSKLINRMECKIVIVGDAKVGKTALIKRLTEGRFLESYTPTGFDKVLAIQEVNKHNVEFVLWDTSGSPSYDSVRSLSYEEADVFLLCFKVSDPISLYHAKNKWTPEIRKHRIDAPIVLCGCQVDLRNDSDTIKQLAKVGRIPVNCDQALAICCEIGACNYVETTAKAMASQKDISEAFEMCALAAIRNGFKRNSSINIGSVVQHGSHTSYLKNSIVGDNHVLNISFGSHNSERNLHCGSSTKSSGNISYHEDEINGNFSEQQQRSSHPPPILEDDVFPLDGGVFRNNNSTTTSAVIRSPSFGAREQHHQVRNSGLIRIRGDENPDGVMRNSRGSIVVMDGSNNSSTTSSSAAAQLRSNGLSRRTSFRSQVNVQQKSIPVSTPKSPLANNELKSPISDSSSQLNSPPIIQIFDLKTATSATSPSSSSGFPVKLVGFESLKSHTSTGSQGSTGSKTSTTSQASIGSSLASARAIAMMDQGTIAKSNQSNILDPDVPNTEDPELLSQLQFISPKNGVFRPVPNSTLSANGKKKQNCCIM